VDAFKQVFLNKSAEYTYLDATGESSFSSMSSGDVLKEMGEISAAARAIYDRLHLGNKWNLPGKHGHHAAATVNKWDNCELWIIYLRSDPSLMMRKSARRHAKH
jgi:hypothetical protein